MVQLPWKAVAKTGSGFCLAQSDQESGATLCYGCPPIFAPKPAVIMSDLWPGTWLILRLTSELLPCPPQVTPWCQVKIKVYVSCYSKSLLDLKKNQHRYLFIEGSPGFCSTGSCPSAGGDWGVVQDSSRSPHPAHLGVFCIFLDKKRNNSSLI